MRPKLVIVVSHPIQHFVPFYRALAAEKGFDLTVIFATRIGVDPYFDKDMNTTIAWKMDLLGGYDHVFLPEAEQITSTSPRNVNNPSVGAELSRQKPGVVMIYGYNYITSLRALWWCKRNRVPAMMISDSELKTQRSRRTTLLKSLLVPRILNRFDAFLTVGDCNEDYYKHYGIPRERLFRAPFTIDEDVYQSAYHDRAALRSKRRSDLGIPPDEILVLTVGKLSKRKRPGDVVDAARRLKSVKLPAPIRFVLAGNGEELERLKHIVKSENLPVLLPGFVNVDVLPEYYAAADMIVHPSSRDPHPLVTCEGSCMGLPLVLSSRVGAIGPTDSARISENAEVFPVTDTAALAQIIENLVRDPARRETMAARSREIFEDLDMRRSVRGTHTAVNFVIGRGSRT